MGQEAGPAVNERRMQLRVEHPAYKSGPAVKRGLGVLTLGCDGDDAAIET